jgi:hypothetical protein
MEIASQIRGLIPGIMPEAPRNFTRWIDEGLTRAGHGAVAELARRLGLSTDKVSKMRSGHRRPQASELPRIEEFFGELSPKENAHGEAGRGMATTAGVRVVGYVGAGATEYRYAVAQGDLDEVPPPYGATPRTVAVEVRGDSLGTMFDRWLVFYDDVRTPVTDDLIGKLCVVGLEDDHVMVKKIRAGARPGQFDLISERADPIRNVTIAWAARVKIMAPRG